MTTKFSGDSVPITDLKVNPIRVVRHTAEARRPVLLTSDGRGEAVLQSVCDNENGKEERDFMRSVVAGLSDLKAADEVFLDDARTRLGLK